MLNLPRLDDLDYQKLFDHARAMIPSYNSGWTDLNDHDPGITTLQTFAWLCDSLNFYINAAGEAHRLNYLKLMGIRPRRTPAQCYLAVEAASGREVSVPQGARVLAGDTVFELLEPLEGRSNRMVRLYGEEGERRYDLTAFVGEDGGFAPILTDQTAGVARAYFGFEEPLEREVRLFFPVEETGRNPYEEGFTLVELQWEFWNGGSWEKAETVSDETCGLLKSGRLTLRLPGDAAPLEEKELARAYYLRCVPARGCYDLRPRVGRAMCCCVRARQTDTAVRSVELRWDGEAVLKTGCWVGERDLLSVSVEEDGLWSRWYHRHPGPDDRCAVEQDRIYFDEKRFGCLPPKGARVLVTIARPDARILLGETDGCALQSLELDTEGLYRLRLALVRTGEDGRQTLSLFEECPNLAQAGYDEAVFAVLRQEGRVVFGDSIHGIQPEAGLTVEVAELVRSRFAEGNVLRGQLNQWEEPQEDVSVFNLENAAGGEDRSTFEQLEPLLEKKLREVTRAVTSEDIGQLVLRTPGLLIDSVTVVPMEEYCAAAGVADVPENTVLVVVKPKSGERLPRLSEDYIRVIRRHLDGYRLISSNLRVQPARYVRVDVYGRIRLEEPGGPGEQEVLEALAQLIEGATFGQRVDFGRLYSRLEMLPGVRRVAQLSLECAGAGGGKNEQGDVVLHPDCLSYLGEVGIEFV